MDGWSSRLKNVSYVRYRTAGMRASCNYYNVPHYTYRQPRSKSMDTNTQVLQQCFIDEPSESPDAASSIDARAADEVRRSENNILAWMSYLPEDCIRTMIAMGWDVST
jgi:hypothetical protein